MVRHNQELSTVPGVIGRDRRRGTKPRKVRWEELLRFIILRAVMNRAEIIESVLPHVCGYANASAVDTAATMPDSLYLEKRNYEPKKG